MEKRVPPYFIKYLADKKKRVRQNKESRIQRFRSAIFTLPELQDVPMLSIVMRVNDPKDANGLAAVELPKGIELLPINTTEMDASNENWNMAMNRKALTTKGKIIALAPSVRALETCNISNLISTIAEDELNKAVVFGEGGNQALAMSIDSFLMARGLDELMPEIDEAITDLALRLDLLGVHIVGKNLLEKQTSVNIEKGDLLVNYGVENFNF